MGPIRVLHVFGNLDTGGAESRTMDIYRQIDRSKVQFDFLVHTEKKGYFEDEINDLGGKVYRVPSFSPRNFFEYFKQVNNFFKLISNHRVVHGHMLTTAFIYQFLARKNGVVTRVAHARAGTRGELSFINLVKEILEKLSRFQVTDMFAVSKIAGNSKFGKRKVSSGEVKVVPNAIKADKFKFNQTIRESMREKFNVERELLVGHIGRFQPQKNHLFLLDIFNEIRKIYPESLLILIGDGPYKEKIETKIKKLEMSKNVILLGIRSDIQDLLQAIDVLVFPSTHEGFPGVVLESQAAGIPCIISDQITEEVNVTNQVKYVPLNEDSHYWAEQVVNTLNEFDRKDGYDLIKNSDYDINSTARWYEEFYLKRSH
ncbi:glycosyl transferase group 1 [Marinococcus halophilus]|uniref:Putative glycosyltransferase EpsF n=1 Tax=Marinococcus halophilus TaxID=1371 RepID=A0A510Y303_MARHA|nr:glycosyltransferase family 1 protein [Marinococcus halophilus]OZT81742.1 glycosyl transferase group 1 [Marinococcus halophilus]GEK57700.1 putative glycosyltransferase EpsF [Marinococcus halophilus]